MPRYYNYNAAAGGDGLTRATAWKLLDTANANMPGGDRLYVSHLSNEQRPSGHVNFDFVNHTTQNPIDVVSADFSSGEPPTVLQAGASISPANYAHIYFRKVGCIYGFNMLSLGSIYVQEGLAALEDCFLQLRNNDASRRLFSAVAGADTIGRFHNCVFSFRHPNQGFFLGRGAKVEIVNGTLQAGSTCQQIIYVIENDGTTFVVDGFDASGQSGGSFNFIGALAIGSGPTEGASANIELNRILLPSGGGIIATPPIYGGWEMNAYSIDDGDAFYRFQRNAPEGQVRESTAVYRADGAQYDKAGSPTEYQYSVQMAATAATRPWFGALRYPLFQRRLDANPTLKAHVAYDRAAGPWTNHEVWIEVARPRAGSRAVTDVLTSRPTNGLGTPTALTTSSATWTQGFTDPVFSEVELAITGGGAGRHKGWLCFAPGVAATLYGCPRFEVV